MRENNRRLVAAPALLLFLAACSTGTGDSSSRDSGGARGAPKPGAAAGTLMFGMAGEVNGPAACPAPPREMAKRDGLEAVRQYSEAPSTEQYAPVDENPFLRAAREPLSTFSIDVDTASYAVVRRHLAEGRLPPPGAVRIEELVNYFPYDYAPPSGDPQGRAAQGQPDNPPGTPDNPPGTPFAVHLATTACPWKPDHRLVRIGLKGRVFPEGERPASNLVFLVDVSGSMMPENKLPLLVRSFKLLAQRLEPRDRVSMVVYAGSSGLVLPPTTGDRKQEILDALDRLTAGGSTNGGAGIRLAYKVAEENFVKGGTNRVILATDGDFNVGTTSNDELVSLVTEKAKSGVFLTVLGFGVGNYKDDRLESLADRGNGNYAYVDSIAEGQKVLVEQAGGTLHTIAKDVKIQVEFNPARVAGWRLLGYENRLLRSRDFADDRKDAGEIGAGHTVTALYEVVPAGVPVPAPEEPELKYQEAKESAASAGSEMLTVRLRWKAPDGDVSLLSEFPLVDRGLAFGDADPEFRFAASVACFGLVLRGSAHRASASFDTALELAQGTLGADANGWRHEFLALVTKARSLAATRETATK